MTRDTRQDSLEDDLQRVFGAERERDRLLIQRLQHPRLAQEPSVARRPAGSSLAWAASILVLVSLLVVTGHRQESLAYEVVCGEPRVEGAAVGRLVKDRWLETDDVTQVRLHMEGLGIVDVGEGSRICLRAANEAGYRMPIEPR